MSDKSQPPGRGCLIILAASVALYLLLAAIAKVIF